MLSSSVGHDPLIVVGKIWEIQKKLGQFKRKYFQSFKKNVRLTFFECETYVYLFLEFTFQCFLAPILWKNASF